MSRFSVTAIAGTIALSLAGCASSPPPLSPLALQAAQQEGSLQSLYDQNTARIAGQNLRTERGRQALDQHNRMGSMLAQNLEATFRKEQQQLTQDGLVPLPLIEAQRARIPDTLRWDPAAYRRLTGEFAAIRDKTRAGIAARQDELAQLGPNDGVKRTGVLASLAALTRDPRYERERTDVLAGMRQRIEEAIQKEQYPEARQAIKELQQITPDDAELRARMTLVNTRLFEREIWNLLTEGKADDAYARFMAQSEAPEFPEMLQLLGGSTGDMVAYFVAQAGTAFSENRYADTYHLLNQVRDLRARANAEDNRPPQEQAFLKTIQERYVSAAEAGNIGLALGYLKVIERFDPQYPGLQDNLRATQELALAKATRRIELKPFTNATGNAEFGGAVAASLTEHLSAKVPKGLQLLDQKPAEPAKVSEAKPGKKKGRKETPKAEPIAADYVIQGQILESRVDTSQEEGSNTMRVTTGNETVDNPAYLEWAALPEDQRGGQPAPEPTITREASEDVTVKLQVQRKVGVVTASFRLVEAATGKVLASGSETLREEIAAEGNEGMERGQFRLPPKLPTLPADSEILQKLTARISGVIGDKVVQQLQRPEARYAEAAKRFVEEGNLALAADNEAYSFTLATLNGHEASTQTLEQYAVKAL
ncbi:MAG: hypothetical protein K0S46_759 [Moraxellaceae bacterium]|jgi:hypothetical protein|nr:hypothetical protein [Moraxellaceae bacterium]